MLEEFDRNEGIRHLRRGLALERANRITEAAEEYRQAIERYPHLREAHDALGMYYQRSGQLAKAAEEFRIVAKLEGDFLSFFNLGFVLIELERFEEALDAFQECLHMAPEDSATHFELGLIHFSRGDFGTALDHLQRPLRSYPEDWEVRNLIGKCFLGLRRFDEALGAFGQALQLAASPEAQAELFENIASVERYREFRNLHGSKDQIYAEDGVVYLGSAQDDGLQLAEAQDYHFTYPDIGTTLQRMMALQHGYRWKFSSVVAVDKPSRPLANALATLLDLPQPRTSELRADDNVLLVMAVAREAELLLTAVEHLPCQAVTFCLGLNWLRHSRILPEIIGIAARGSCSVPWEPELRRLLADGAPAAEIAACIENASSAIVQAVNDTPLDTNLPRQVRYYTRNHRRLIFLDQPVGPRT